MNSAGTIEKEQIEMDWWVEILSHKPCCIYYFGPFDSAKEAALAQDGYIEDLVNEGAEGITVQIKWCKPRGLTIFPEDEAESFQVWGEFNHTANDLKS
ncbi:DUF1816 domain-containing protein [Mastigocladopsis repens]|uniref:DUF1816 domain-containing protein n=1 Tax=Mastigocladopsis repens TaxID=221287 RepID=UPI0002E1880F|nr:DUF1816 domain-containing protein [Mastigocladopsis repens]